MPKRRANGEGSIYQRKDGTWTAQYTDATGKKRYLYGKTQQIVRGKLKEAIRQTDAGIALEPKKTTFSDWVREWLEVYQRPVLRDSTFNHNMGRWRIHIAPYFGKVQLNDIRHEQLQRFFNEKMTKRLDGKPGGYAPAMCELLSNIIHGALGKAVELGYIPNNPADRLQLPRRVRAEKCVFTMDEQRRFEEQVRADMRNHPSSSIYLLMLYTGLRVGEAMGLQKSDIDFENREFHVRRTVGVIHTAEGKGVQFYVNDPKTKAGKRTIPMSEAVVRLLQEQIAKREELVACMADRWAAMGKSLDIVNAGYLYISPGGTVIYKANIDHRMGKLLEEAGIESHVTLHGLRHTFATRWIEAGLDVRSLAEILGHSDVKMTLNIYTHSLPEQRRKGMDAMGAWLASDTENAG